MWLQCRMVDKAGEESLRIKELYIVGGCSRKEKDSPVGNDGIVGMIRIIFYESKGTTSKCYILGVSREGLKSFYRLGRPSILGHSGRCFPKEKEVRRGHCVATVIFQKNTSIHTQNERRQFYVQKTR